jgi:hypothetical protein
MALMPGAIIRARKSGKRQYRNPIFNIAARGTFKASWSAPIPAGHQMQVVVSVIANGGVNPANNQAAGLFAAASANAPARR